MNHWFEQLRDELDRLAAGHLLRRLEPIGAAGPVIERGDRRLVNLASNDYLGLSQHPHLRDAAIDAVRTNGVGAGASRLVSGDLTIHEQVEQRFAAFKHAEAALLCPTGYQANLAALGALARRGDLVCIDKLCHASLIDAARASNATVRVYPHLNIAKLQRLLQRHSPTPGSTSPRTSQHAAPDRQITRAFIVTDAVFSMDGDTADLCALCDLAERYDAILIVDEAHATGVLGETGAGLCELQGVSDRVHVVVSTAGKALGGMGGVITARRVVIDTLINRARTFIYTTAPPAAQAAVIGAALDVVRDEPWRRQRVLELSQRVRDALLDLQLILAPGNAPGSRHPQTPIIPVVTGPPDSALALSAHLLAHGLFAPAIRPPTVAPGASRVRLSLRADLEDDHVSRLIDALTTWTRRT